LLQIDLNVWNSIPLLGDLLSAIKEAMEAIARTEGILKELLEETKKGNEYLKSIAEKLKEKL